MNLKPRQKIIRKLTVVLLSFFILNFVWPVPTARAIPVEEVASIPSALQYIFDKIGTIFFQNILRDVLNEFAKDAAIYVGSGGNGQEALYVKQKWGNFWTNIGDAATGDFIESFANSVISDIAATDLNSENTAFCDKQAQECNAKAGTEKEQIECGKQQQLCLSRTDETQAQNVCTGNYDKCLKSCQEKDLPGLPGCEASCQTVYNSCSANVGLTRRKPMLGLGSPLASINICNPSFSVGVKIAYGLVAQQRQSTLGRGSCKFSEMAKNWTDEYQRIRDMSSRDFLKNISTIFEPGSSDLYVALTLNSNLLEYRGERVLDKKQEVVSGKGWLDARNLAGDLLGVPGESETTKKLAEEKLWENLGTVTGDILIDAANIFLNQLALTAWKNLMGNLSQENVSNLGFYQSRQTGRKAIENRLNKITEPVFSGSGKLDILSKLSVCPKPATPGPTECVIASEFASAVSNKMTVWEAVKANRLPADWPFGFDKNGEDTISYNQGYPYRSLLILRKYRILPVGWEVAAQEIQRKYLADEFKSDRPNGVTLGDLLACFSPCDEIKGYGDGVSVNNKCQAPTPDLQAWCRDLLDPNWVLKVPEYYCAREGYGPAVFKEPDLIPTGNKLCSSDDGATRTKIDNKEKFCTTNDDCCSDAELARRDKLISEGNTSEARKFACAAACTYDEKRLQVYRLDSYCADEQGCIKEGKNGSCLFFGYCTEERRKWVFNKDNKDESCEPRFNTCQNFRGPGGNRLAYLTNTLDYSCDAAAVGCKEYASGGVYDAASDKLAWNRSQSVYFNKKISTCQNREEGCHEFIRVKDNNGVNLLADGGFEAYEPARWASAGKVASVVADRTNKVFAGGYSLRIGPSDRGLYYGPSNKTMLPGGFEFELNRFYTLSARVYVLAGEVRLTMGKESDRASWQTVYSDGQNAWQELVVALDNDFTINADYFTITGNTAATDFFLDNVKFEMGQYSGYTPYRGNNLVTEKLLPDYLAKTCYKNPPSDYSLLENAPAKCAQFVRQCNRDEVGCELYTEVTTKDTTAAQVKPKDYCPAECVGFDTFIQQANNFYSARDDYFIPRTARACSAQSVGCSRFVNLDKIKEGGEANEYYSKFRRCVKDSTGCAEFYTWEGSDESGYQLVVYQLKANADKSSGISQPETIDDTNTADTDDGDACNETLYGLPPDHPSYNPDCRQFYGRDGNVSYHLFTSTISCNQECHPYRLVDNNVDVTLTDLASCRAANGVWLADKEQCVVCLNGGEWQEEHQACVYLADISQSRKCSVSEVGCSEYEGDFSNNVRVIVNDNFESGLAGWGETVEISSDSLNVGGHSLKLAYVNKDGRNTLSTRFTKSVKGQIKAGKRYVLSFVAKKKSADVNFGTVALYGGSGGHSATVFAEKVEVSGDWQQYKFDIPPVQESHLDKVDLLYFNVGSGKAEDIRLDNVKLLEMSDSYFLIKNSWTTPASCNQDLQGNPAPLAMLGCKQYTDRDNKVHNLKNFDKLCQLSAVGCELMIDTHNSSYYGEEKFANGPTVPADNFAYVVYEKNKECTAAQKGCSRLGLYNDATGTHKDVYLVNNPDRYQDILCAQNQVGCEAWTNDSGSEVFFKDPGQKVCEFRAAKNGSSYNWYKVKTNHCLSNTECTATTDCAAGQYCALVRTDAGGQVVGGYCADRAVCKNKSECAAAADCKLIDVDDDCPTSYHQTIGLGAAGEKLQPLGMTQNGNAGACGQNQNGCTEYIDPESKGSYDLSTRSKTSVNLTSDTLYVIKAPNGGTAQISGCQEIMPDGTRGAAAEIYYINKDNTIAGPAAALSTPVGLSREFYLFAGGEEKNFSCSLSGIDSIKEAVVNYRLKDTLNKAKPSTVNFELGQVLFNERSFSGGKYNPLLYNTNQSQTDQPPAPGPGNDNNANALLQVDPDRECAKWLGCKSYIDNPLKKGEKICYERGLCDQLDKSGECANFNRVSTASGSQSFASKVKNIGNLTGYSKVGYDNNKFNADLYQLAVMREQGGPKVRFDGSFENAWDTDFVSATDPTARAAVINDARVLEKELSVGGYKSIPDGQAVGKTNVCVTKTVDNVSDRFYVVSAYVYLRYGDRVDLNVANAYNTTTCPFEAVEDASGKSVSCNGKSYAIIGSSAVAGRWVRLTGKFSIANSYRDPDSGDRGSQIKIGLCPINGLAYFDDVRLEPALNIKDKQYLHSACRLYPEQNSMTCDYYDPSGLRKKGWGGYCLESDPRNPNVCLLWYPLDKVESEEFEEGAAINIPKDLYYCLDAEDQCRAYNKVEPEFYCKKFVKVDKDKYWYDRINKDSVYTLPNALLNGSGKEFSVDFGVNAGSKLTGFTLNQQAGSGYYGAYSSAQALLGNPNKATVGISAGKLMPFIPYYGFSRAGQALDKDERVRYDSYFCRATLNNFGQDSPFILEHGTSYWDLLGGRKDVNYDVTTPNIYDDCFVRGLTEGNYDDDPCKIEDTNRDNVNKNDVCCNWDPASGRCKLGDENESMYCLLSDNKRDFSCKYFRCASGSEFISGMCGGPPDYPQPGYSEPIGAETRCFSEKVVNTQGNFKFRATDTDNDNQEVICLFDCFNHTNDYSVASNSTTALEAVKRLFIGSSGYLEWAGASYGSISGTPIQSPVDLGLLCPGNSRTSETAYCYVRPEISRAWLSTDNVSGAGWVTLNFTSKVDLQQLPLRSYRIDWGYQQDGFEATATRNVNMFGRPSENNPHTVYFFFDYNDIDKNNCTRGGCGANCCEVRPSVKIFDNWDAYDSPDGKQVEKALCVCQ